MIAPHQLARPAFELLDPQPAVDVAEREYHRLLGYPRDHVPGERSRELAAWARATYAELGRPWVYLRKADLHLGATSLEIDGVEFRSPKLHDHLRATGAQAVMLMAVSAGAAGEEHARRLWEEGKPDEYFFLEVLGSAVVEHLVWGTNGRTCELAAREGLLAVPHYSPGYTGWDIAEQNRLFELINHGRTQPLPGPLEILPSGMPRPKKSLLGVIGLAPDTGASRAAAGLSPCETCALAPCQYRRAPYRHGPTRPESVSMTPLRPRAAAPRGLNRAARYSVNPRALQRWADERVRLDLQPDGAVAATFRFDGTTCSNMGRALAFEYHVRLAGPEDAYRLLAAECRPAPDDDGYTAMCAYLTDGDDLLRTIASAPPLLGRPLDDVLAWERESAPSGCYCLAESRAHKWGLALEAIHFALAQRLAADAPADSP